MATTRWTMNNSPPRSKLECAHCGAEFGVRERNTIIGQDFAVSLTKTHKIRCGACGLDSDFPVDKRAKKVKNRKQQTVLG